MLSTTSEDFLKGVVSKESEAGSLDIGDASTSKEVIPSVVNLQHDEIDFLLLFLSLKTPQQQDRDSHKNMAGTCWYNSLKVAV